MKALFLTYNSVGKAGTYPNGQLERNGHTAIIAQHPKGKQWGVNGALAGPTEATNLANAASQGEKENLNRIVTDRNGLVTQLYREVLGLEEIPDYVVVYVGSGGSQGAIQLASHLPAEKVRFVLCDCNLDEKLDAINHSGMGDSQCLYCECGGHRTMEGVLQRFFETGVVGPA